VSAATSQNQFDEAARLERIVQRYESQVVVSSDHANFKNLFRDHVAQQLLGSNWSGDTPIAVNTDGNCLFKTLSVALYGHQQASSEIRLNTCLEMVEHVHSNKLLPDINNYHSLQTANISTQNIIRQGIHYAKAPWEVRRNVNIETPDEIINHRIIQNTKYNNDKKSRPENILRQIIADDILSVLCMFPNINFINGVKVIANLPV